MKYAPVNKDHTKVRLALWEAHGRKCFYERIPLRYTEMTIDHIIPQQRTKQPERLAELFSELELPADFSVDSIYNLVPAGASPNRRKSNHDYSLNTLRFYLEQAAILVPKYFKELELNESRSKQDSLIQRIDLLSGQSSTYDEADHITENHGTFVEDHIRLYAHLPNHPHTRGSCLFTLKSVMLRDCMITFDHAEIMSTLLVGVNSGTSFEQRRFFVGTNDQGYYVQLGNNRFSLTLEELLELCRVVDRLAPVYLDALEKMEHKRQIKRFDKSNTVEDSFRVLRITRHVWNLLLDFAGQFDMDSGTSEWHLFDSHPSILKVWRRDVADSRRRPLAIFWPEQVEPSSFISYRSADQEMWLVWQSLEDEPSELANEETQNFDRLWNPEAAYRWLVEDLIPYAFYLHSRSTRTFGFLSTRSFKSFCRTFDVSQHVCLRQIESETVLEDTSSIAEATRIADNLQTFFHTRRQIYLEADGLRTIYALMIAYIDRCPECATSYVAGNLGHMRAREDESLTDTLSLTRQKLANGDHNAYQTDLFFRALGEMLDVLIRRRESNPDAFVAREFIDSIREIWKYRESQIRLARLTKY